MELKHGRGGGLVDDGNAFTRSVGRQLSLQEREVIAQRLVAGVLPAQIAREIGRHRSTVTRELARHRGADGSYYASVAHVQAAVSARRAKPFKLAENAELCRWIEEWIDDGWSPKLIADVLAELYPDDHTQRVSHETIYQALYVQARGNLRADLARSLSTRRTARRSRTATRRGGGSPFTDAFGISQRPAEADDRAVPGHWEGDLIVGPGHASAVGTLVERSTRFTILLHLPHDHTADTVATAMIAAMRQLPEHLRRSITWDRGTELAKWRDIQLALDLKLFFADPHSPWQRGSNENTNRLLRHWLEKGTDLSTWSPADLRRIQDKLNTRPRPTLGLKTPAQALVEHLELAA